MCVRGRLSISYARAALPFIGDEYHAPQTYRLITRVPTLGRRVVEEVGRGLVGREPIKYHICIKMPSLGSRRPACYFKDACLTAVEVCALHAGIALYTISNIYVPRLYFTGLPQWVWSGVWQSSPLVEQ